MGQVYDVLSKSRIKCTPLLDQVSTSTNLPTLCHTFPQPVLVDTLGPLATATIYTRFKDIRLVERMVRNCTLLLEILSRIQRLHLRLATKRVW